MSPPDGAAGLLFPPAGEEISFPTLALALAPAAPADADADFRRCVERELAFLQRSARRWHRDQANADDLIQDTIVQALANADLWQAGTNLRGWLFTIMRNQFFAAAVRAKRGEAALDAVAVAGLDASPGPAADARLVVRDIERALRRLPADQRTAVRLVGIDGKSYAEAAALMGMTVAALRCHLMRGRERLRTIVNSGGGGRRGGSRRQVAMPQTAAAAAAELAF